MSKPNTVKAICACGKELSDDEDERLKEEWEAFIKYHPELLDNQ